MMSCSKPRVFVTHQDVPASALQLLSNKCELVVCPALPVADRTDLLRCCRNVEAIFWSSQVILDKEIIEAAGPGLRCVSTMSAGFNNLDLAELRRRGVQVGHVPHVNTAAVAEIAVGLLLEVARRIPEARSCIYRNEWLPFRPQWMVGKDIVGSTVGIVGLGSIGQAVAKRLRAFEIERVLYCGHNKKPEGDALGAEFVRFEELLQQSDFIVISCPLADDTRWLFNQETFALMKSSAILINVARGGIVEQESLIRALQTGQIWGAGLDVTTPEPLTADHPLLQLKNCVITPHLGAMTERTQRIMGEMTARNILAALEGSPMPAPIPE